MDNYRIILEEKISKETRDIVNKYWKRDNNEFINSPTYLMKVFNINQKSLTEIITSNSKCIIDLSNCINCSTIISKTVTSQTYFKRTINEIIKRCSDCENIYQDQKKIEDEAWEKIKIAALEDPYYQENYKLLDIEEIETFKIIVNKYSNRKINYLQENIFDDEYYWFFIGILVEKSLLYVKKHSNSFELIVSNFFVEKFANHNEEQKTKLEKQVYIFNIPQNDKPNIDNNRKYYKELNLLYDVNLSNENKYTISASILTDGSLNISIEQNIN